MFVASLPNGGIVQGIYFIKNIKTGRVYVGKSVDFEARKSHHLSSLKSGKHRNRWLQADYDQLGVSAFEFGMLEETEDLARREDFWINEQDNPYNKNSCRPKSKMSQMPSILRRIRHKGLDQAKGV